MQLLIVITINGIAVFINQCTYNSIVELELQLNIWPTIDLIEVNEFDVLRWGCARQFEYVMCRNFI